MSRSLTLVPLLDEAVAAFYTGNTPPQVRPLWFVWILFGGWFVCLLKVCVHLFIWQVRANTKANSFDCELIVWLIEIILWCWAIGAKHFGAVSAALAGVDSCGHKYWKNRSSSSTRSFWRWVFWIRLYAIAGRLCQSNNAKEWVRSYIVNLVISLSKEKGGGNESQHATAVEQTQRCSNSGMEGGVICILPPCLFCVFVCLKHPDCLGDYAHTHNTHVRLSSKNGRRIGQASSPDIVNSSRTSESLCVQTTWTFSSCWGEILLHVLCPLAAMTITVTMAMMMWWWWVICWNQIARKCLIFYWEKWPRRKFEQWNRTWIRNSFWSINSVSVCLRIRKMSLWLRRRSRLCCGFCCGFSLVISLKQSCSRRWPIRMRMRMMIMIILELF